MSSYWDAFGQRLANGTITFAELKELMDFLEEMDAVNNNVVITYLQKSFACGYKFTNYGTFLHDVQHKGITREQIGWLLSNLHDFDHANEQVIMNSISNNKHYWSNHKVYRTCIGTFKEGKWIPKKVTKK